MTIIKNTAAGCWWLTPVILATQEAEIRRIVVRSQPWANSSQDPISKNPNTKKGLVEWLKVKVLSSSPSAAEKENNRCWQGWERGPHALLGGCELVRPPWKSVWRFLKKLKV
jgi:hypothetical protein